MIPYISADIFTDIGNFFNGVITFFEIVILIIILIVICVIIYKIAKKVQETAEKNRKIYDYVKTMKMSYSQLSRSAQEDIYKLLIQHNNHQQKARTSDDQAKRYATYNNKEGVMNGLIGAMAGYMMADECLSTIKKKYGVSINKEYMKYDIEYLNKLLGKH